MPEFRFEILFAALLLWLFWLAMQARYVFVIRIGPGSARLDKGRAPAEFVHAVGEVCTEFHIQRGWVGGVWHGRRVRLKFSRHIPPPCQQRLRNLWTAQR